MEQFIITLKSNIFHKIKEPTMTEKHEEDIFPENITKITNKEKKLTLATMHNAPKMYMLI